MKILFFARIRLLQEGDHKHILRLWARVFADAAVVESGLGWAEQPGWQGPVLSTRKALIQKQEAQGNKDNNMPKKPLENNKTTQKASKRVSGGWLPAALQITRLSESLLTIAESYSIFSNSLISSAGEEWILTCKRHSTMGNKLIISNQIFLIARGGGELISDRSRISPQPVNPFAPAGKHAHTHCLEHTLFRWLRCLTRWIRALSPTRAKDAHLFSLVYQQCKYSFNFK